MFERIKDCICHPRFIGKYNKDHVGIVILTILLFFVFCLAMLAGRSYTEPAFDETTNLMFVSSLVKSDVKNTQYDSLNHKVTGESFELNESGYKLIVLPKEETLNLKLDSITVVLYESEATVYFSTMNVSHISYTDIQCSSFQFGNVAKNNPTDIYHFKILIDEVLDSSRVFFQTFSFLQEAISLVVYYLICVVFCYVLSIAINPTISKGVRAKFCFYDGCVFFIGAFFAYLFNFGMLIYFSLALPLIYTIITFRHVIKVVIRR